MLDYFKKDNLYGIKKLRNHKMSMDLQPRSLINSSTNAYGSTNAGSNPSST